MSKHLTKLQVKIIMSMHQIHIHNLCRILLCSLKNVSFCIISPLLQNMALLIIYPNNPKRIYWFESIEDYNTITLLFIPL